MESKDLGMDPWETHVLLFSSFTKNSVRKSLRIVLSLHTDNTCRTNFHQTGVSPVILLCSEDVTTQML